MIQKFNNSIIQLFQGFNFGAKVIFFSANSKFYAIFESLNLITYE